LRQSGKGSGGASKKASKKRGAKASGTAGKAKKKSAKTGTKSSSRATTGKVTTKKKAATAKKKVAPAKKKATAKKATTTARRKTDASSAGKKKTAASSAAKKAAVRTGSTKKTVALPATTQRSTAASTGRSLPPRNAPQPPPTIIRAPRGGPRKSTAARKRTDSSFRLPRDVAPETYHVHIIPDLNRAIFRGEEIIEVVLEKGRSSIQVHAAELEIDRAEISVRPAAPGEPLLTIEAVEFITHPGRETIELKFPRTLKPGRYNLNIAYHGEIRKKLRGLYAAQSGNRRYAFTQFEAADARRCFPCFDEPDFKARFTFSVTVRSGLTVISNNPVRRTDHNTNGTTTWHFTQTPLLSTYLCAIGVGELESEEQRHLGTVPVRVWHVPGKASMASFALDTAIASLQRLERYFGIPYPYDKLDLVAVPDFEAGAMENAGAVFFRETLLLVDPHSITAAEQKRVAEVIAHELAHMWFGNLVTMKWWDDLWLNEAFATWMAFKIIDEWKPEWRMWNNFEPHRAAALSMDALTNTHPIYADVSNAAEATENFDAITYEKGASVVRMLESYLGEAKFQKGVRAYIENNREGNAVAADLWRALEKASGQPVEKIADTWITQAGFPVVSFSREEAEAPGELSVRQEKFRASPLVKKAGATSWPLPMVIKLPRAGRGAKSERGLIQKARDTFTLKGDQTPDWYYGNADEGGFYRPLHDDACLAELTAHFQEYLEPVERMGLLNHQWAIVRAGQAPLASFLDLVEACRDEKEHEVLDTLAGPLGFLDDQVVEMAGNQGRARFHQWLGSIFGAGRTALGWDADPDEAQEKALLRGSLFRIMGVLAEDREIGEEAATRLDAYLDDPTTLDANLADSFVNVVARDGDYERFTRMRAAIEFMRTPQERRRLQLALADFRQTRAVEQGLAMSLTPEIPTQDVGFLLIRYLSNRVARPAAWAFVQKNWEEIAGRLPPMMASRLIESTALLQTREERKNVAEFFKAHPIETGTRALRLALERFDVNEEFRERAGAEYVTWLEGPKATLDESAASA
jgi:puromycin-sensitive aminopeptidase